MEPKRPFEPRRRKRQTPESKRYSELKGYPIRIQLERDPDPFIAILQWVDRYTIGICRSGREIMLNKGSIRTIEAAKGHTENGNNDRGETLP
jgi:hypothetical protein